MHDFVTQTQYRQCHDEKMQKVPVLWFLVESLRDYHQVRLLYGFLWKMGADNFFCLKSLWTHEKS